MRILIFLLLMTWPAFGANADVSLPDPMLTPGELNPVLTKEKLCAPSFRTGPFRNVPASLKAQVYAAYHMQNHKGACSGKEGCEVDHLCSIENGGANTLANLWIEPYAGIRWNAHVKDVLENRLHKRICDGTITVEAGCTQIAKNWKVLWMRFVGK
jgi:hypothetical protein